MSEQMVPVTIISSGTGDGGTPIKTGTVAETPGPNPNLIVRVISPALAIVVRAAHLFLTTLLSSMGTAAVLGPEILPFSDFWDLLAKASTLAATATALGFLKDLVTVFKQLEQKYPLMTGQV